RAVRDPRGGVGVRRAAVRRDVLEAAVTGRVVAGRDHDAVGPPGITGRAAPVVDQDRVGDGGRGRVAVQRIGLRGDVVRGQHLERRVEGGAGQRMGVPADEQRALDPLCRAVLDDRLGGRGDVVLVEGHVERGAAVPGGAEGEGLVGVGRVRVVVVVRGADRGHGYQGLQQGHIGYTRVKDSYTDPRNLA